MPPPGTPPPRTLRFRDFHLSGLVSIGPEEELRLQIVPPPPPGAPAAVPPRLRSPPAAIAAPGLRRASWPASWEPVADLSFADPSVADQPDRRPPWPPQPGCDDPAERDSSPSFASLALTSFASRASLGCRRPQRRRPRAVAVSSEPDHEPRPNAFTLMLLASPRRKRVMKLSLRRLGSKHDAYGQSDRVLGQTVVHAHTFATGPVHHALVLAPPSGPRLRALVQSPLCLSFEAHVRDAPAVIITLTDVSVSVDRPVTSAYVVVTFVPDTAPAVVSSASTPSSSSWSSSMSSPLAMSRPSSRLGRSSLSAGQSGTPTTKAVTVVSLPRGASSGNLSWKSLPALRLPSCSMAELAHGTICVRLHDAADDNALLASHRFPYHAVWATRRFTMDLHPPTDTGAVAAMSSTLTVDGRPETSQMLGGVHTDLGIYGARPLIFGVPLPRIHKPISSGVLALPPSRAAVKWLELVDSFGWQYWYDRQAAAQGDPADSWIRPDADGVVSDSDEQLNASYNFERIGRMCFRSRVDGSETWIHPGACHVSGLPSENQASIGTARVWESPTRAQQKGVGAGNSFLPRNELRRQLVVTDGGRASLVPREGASDEEDIAIPLADDLGCATDMRWSALSSTLTTSPLWTCPGTEGHTLTVHGIGQVLKFGGAANGNSKLNSVCSFNPVTMEWSELPAVGALPEGRVGHGAISLGGADMSRMLIFGGASRLGRMNDMHCYDVERNAWSPVACSGDIPPPRARLGMAGWRDSALVFGGREGYSYIGERYFDSTYCFNAARSEWLQIRPRGIGPSERCGSAVQVLSDRLLFVHGGFDEQRYFGDTWLLDMVSCTWQRPPYFDESLQPSPRESHASAVVGKCVLVYGGESEGAYCSDLTLFDGERLRWCGMPTVSGHGPGTRWGSAMAALDDRRVMLVGGSTGFCSMSDTYVLDTKVVSRFDVDALRALGLARGPDADHCVVCLDEAPSQMFAFCGHTVLCQRCSRRSLETCPICRAVVAKTVGLNTQD